MRSKLIKYLSIPLVSMLSFSTFISCNTSKTTMSTEVKPLEISEPTNKMGFQFMKEVNKTEENKNVVLSPLSLSTVLSLLQNGAEGNTKAELMDFLQVSGLTDEEINLNYSELDDYINSMSKKKGQIKMANSIWVKEDFKIEDSFNKIAKDNYSAYVKEIDFSNSSANKKINDWVNKNTMGKLDKVVEQMNPNVVAILINALYFDSQWVTPFDPNLSYKGDFTTSNGNSVEVNYMHMMSDFDYGVFEDYKMLKLPYKMDGFSMNIILPNENVNIDTLIENFTFDTWKDNFANLESKNVIVTIPKFKVEYEKTLNDTLKSLGVKDAFDPGKADFSAMAKDIFIQDVLQKTFVEVDEVGTKAAAITKVEMADTGMPISETFDVNRPFIFTIYDEINTIIYFIGKIENP